MFKSYLLMARIGPLLRSGHSVFKTSERNYFYPVRPGVGHTAAR